MDSFWTDQKTIGFGQLCTFKKRLFRRILPPFLPSFRGKRGKFGKNHLFKVIFADRKNEGFTLIFAGIFNSVFTEVSEILGSWR